MAGEDRISALPEETEVSILSLLSITDAVRTSVLSRSWRHLWTLLSGLDVDRTFIGALDCENTTLRRTEIAHRILSSLRGPIRHFSLLYYYIPNQLVSFHHFLDLIFQKGDLWNLSLTARGQDIQSLIEGSKKLTHIQFSLHPEDGAPPLSVAFNCPLLKYLRFDFFMDAAEARIISAPCLETANVNARIWLDPSLEELVWVGAAALKFMADIAQVSHLSLDFDVFK
ncbi:hypothetical protein LUZ61_004630 [Rhynchospora tenuis]|uniref:F-box domain-containing protein n=1 Tax=Rhynchospora tenuis TaxID=198213 RepID=A0AAD5ZN24_9POAL|nr:hypothetical protein LUZ61_004630 [Rhynchospora tenuis]